MSEADSTAAVHDAAKRLVERYELMNGMLLKTVRADLRTTYECLSLLKQGKGFGLLKPGMDDIVLTCAIIKLEEVISQVVLADTGTELAKLN